MPATAPIQHRRGDTLPVVKTPLPVSPEILWNCYHHRKCFFEFPLPASHAKSKYGAGFTILSWNWCAKWIHTHFSEFCFWVWCEKPHSHAPNRPLSTLGVSCCFLEKNSHSAKKCQHNRKIASCLRCQTAKQHKNCQVKKSGIDGAN